MQQPATASLPAVATTPETKQTSRPTLPPEEQQVLTLAQRFGRVTAKDLVDSLHVSRATATRRLSALAEEGHLVQHGKGRGTYYTAAGYAVAETHGTVTTPDKSATATAVPDTAQILARLSANHLQLQKQYAVEAIRPVASPPTKPMPRLTVRFATVPTLVEFWELRCHLQTLLGQEIDLIPEFPM
ncbi:MAG: HTH domain-containing protein [Caldilineaceae bacterium]|nr:HTH domain-containing protein [Caldilineaceae bacterium]